jgi:hypothetical protein
MKERRVLDVPRFPDQRPLDLVREGIVVFFGHDRKRFKRVFSSGSMGEYIQAADGCQGGFA